MLWSRPPPAARKPTNQREIKGDLMLMGSVGQELHHLEKERAIQTDPEETRRRRTIQLNRKDSPSGSWGFTLQTYGIKNKRSGEVEVMTYVDYVELHGPAWIAGMRRGDVLLSVNGESVEGFNHPMLVEKIQASGDILRLVVLFEDCCRKVELYERFIKLKRILSQKMRDLRQLEVQERMIRSGDRLSRLSLFRDSIRSSTSSDWDRYSELASPGALEATPPNQKIWHQRFFGRSTETLDTSSELSYGCASPFGSSRESLSVRASHESLSQKDSSASSEKNSDFSEGASGGAEVCLGAEASPPDAKFYLGSMEANGDGPKLRRSDENSNPNMHFPGRRRSNSALLNDMRMKLIADSVTTVTATVHSPEAVNMHEGAMNVHADSMSMQANASITGSGTVPITGVTAIPENSGVTDSSTASVAEDSVKDTPKAGSESDASQVEKEEEASPCRLYRGVRINDADENTRL